MLGVSNKKNRKDKAKGPRLKTVRTQLGCVMGLYISRRGISRALPKEDSLQLRTVISNELVTEFDISLETDKKTYLGAHDVDILSKQLWIRDDARGRGLGMVEVNLVTVLDLMALTFLAGTMRISRQVLSRLRLSSRRYPPSPSLLPSSRRLHVVESEQHIILHDIPSKPSPSPLSWASSPDLSSAFSPPNSHPKENRSKVYA